MTHTIQSLSFVFLAMGLTLVFFSAYARMKAVWKFMPWYGKVVSAPWMVPGAFLDVVVLNWICSWLILLDMPTQITFTAHCKSLKKRQNIQGVLARAYCVVLDLIAPGHCE